jgi:hypothetical protein
MNNLPSREPIVGHGRFGVFAVDRFGSVGDLVGMWYPTLAEAERYLIRAKEQYSQNLTALSSAEHATRLALLSRPVTTCSWLNLISG